MRAKPRALSHHLHLLRSRYISLMNAPRVDMLHARRYFPPSQSVIHRRARRPFVVDLSTYSIPFLIFIAEVCALTVSTLRIIFVSRGHKFLAPLLGFFEIMIWLFAIGETMRNLDNWACFIAFAL